MRKYKFLKVLCTDSYALPFLAALILWCIAFRGFLLDHYPLIHDALSYLSHTHELLEALAQGSYPLWTRDSLGMPNDFFLMRLGAYNPLYLVMAFLRLMRIPFLMVYLWTLAFYYFIGCLGFYCLAKRLTQNRLAAFFGFLVLYFSSLGTRLFDSFIILVFVPLAWFFYFLVAFCRNPSKKNFFGIVFTVMLLLSTYIPFYFILLAGLVVFLALAVFPVRGFACLRSAGRFIRREKLAAVIGVIALIISMYPGYLFFSSSRGGDYVMPSRNRNVEEGSSFQVHADTTKEWAILEDIAFSVDFSDFRRMQFAVLYIPVFAWVLFGLGLLTRFNRRLLFYILFSAALLCIGIPWDLPVYNFLYTHIPVFQYFRNLHFFLWWAILPCFILILIEQLRAFFLAEQKYSFWQKTAWLSFVHAVVLAAVIQWHDHVYGTVMSVVFSWVFFIAYASGRMRRLSPAAIGLCALGVVVVQPLEIYHYIAKNSLPRAMPYHYEQAQTDSPYRSSRRKPANESGHASFHIGLSHVQDFTRRLSIDVFNRYTQYRFMLYDAVCPYPEHPGGWKRFSGILAERQNCAFISGGRDYLLGGKLAQAIFVEGPEDGVRILRSTPNKLMIETLLDEPKILVWNDAFHRDWRAFLDGDPIGVDRVNIAFKGVYVPAGEHRILFEYKTTWHLLFSAGMSLVFCAIFFIVVAEAVKEKGTHDVS